MGEVYVDTVLEAYNLTTSPYKMSATKLDTEIEYNNVVSYFKIARNRVSWAKFKLASRKSTLAHGRSLSNDRLFSSLWTVHCTPLCLTSFLVWIGSIQWRWRSIRRYLLWFVHFNQYGSLASRKSLWYHKHSVGKLIASSTKSKSLLSTNTSECRRHNIHIFSIETCFGSRFFPDWWVFFSYQPLILRALIL